MNGAALERFTPLTLDELVDRAELLTRVDRKYVLTASRAGRLLGRLDADTRVLEIDGRRRSAYESVYFDTPDLLTYRMSVQQRRRRIKLRTRCYLDAGEAFLEAKTRQADATVKCRTGHSSDARTWLDEEARRYAAEALSGVGQPPVLAQRLTATLVTSYQRATLLADDVRVTVDTDLSWSIPDGARLDTGDLVILETKSPGAASGVDRLLWHSGVRPVAISKYATGLAALRPDLPRNRWARVLRDHFERHSLPPAVSGSPRRPAPWVAPPAGALGR